MDRLVCPQGADMDWALTLSANGIESATGFTGADTPAVSVWPGGSRSPLSPSPLAVEWINPSRSTVKLSALSARTAGLIPGMYAVELTVLTAGGRKIAAGVLQLVIEQTAGTEAAPPVYGPDDDGDLAMHFPAIRRLARETDQTGFRAQRAEARAYLDNLIVQRYRPLANGRDAFGAGPGTFGGFGGFGAGGAGWGWDYSRDTAPSKQMATWLAANGLKVTLTVRRLVAYYALWLILGGQVESKGDTGYSAQASKFLALFDAEIRNYRAEIDTNGDGNPDVFVDFAFFTMHQA